MANSDEKKVNAEQLLQAIDEYEFFISWIEVQSRIGFENKNMVPSLVLKQIHSRIKYPISTQLEKARKIVAEWKGTA
jgi:hypothetical protein